MLTVLMCKYCKNQIYSAEFKRIFFSQFLLCVFCFRSEMRQFKEVVGDHLRDPVRPRPDALPQHQVEERGGDDGGGGLHLSRRRRRRQRGRRRSRHRRRGRQGDRPRRLEPLPCVQTTNTNNVFPLRTVQFPLFQLGWEKGRVRKKSGTIWRANDQNSGTI